MSVSMGFLLSAALGIGQAGLGYMAQREQANQQNTANHAHAERLRLARIEDYDALNAMDQEASEGAVDQINEAQLDGLRARETAAVASSAGGISGLSVDALMQDLQGQENRFNESVNVNLDRQRSQFQREGQSMYRQGENITASMPTPQRPSLLATGLRAGTSLYGSYNDYFKVKPQGG